MTDNSTDESKRCVVSINADSDVTEAHTAILDTRSVTIEHEISPDDAYEQVVVNCTDEQADDLRDHPAVRYVEPDEAALEIMGHPVPDAELDAMSESPSWGYERIGAGEVRREVDGSSASVAVLDTGVDSDHPDLTVAAEGRSKVSCGIALGDGECSSTANNQCRIGWDDDNTHGTWCAGAVGAEDNNRGIIGVAESATIGAYKGLDCTGKGYYSDLAYLLAAATDDGYDVLSCSWGGPPSPIIEDAVNYANDHGSTVVAAAGNDGGEVIAPARYGSVIAVGATNSDDELADFSCRGGALDIVAPGVRLDGLVPGGTQVMSGTSMATPLVAGALAVLIDAGLDGDDPRYRLANTTTDIGLPEDEQGAGLLDVDAAVPNEEPEPEPSPDEMTWWGWVEWAFGEIEFDLPFTTTINSNAVATTVGAHNITEAEFEKQVATYLIEEFGRENVATQVVLESDRRVDILLKDGALGITYTIELENSYESVAGGMGQTLRYAGHHPAYQPLVIIPEGCVEQPEFDIDRQRVPIVEFPVQNE